MILEQIIDAGKAWIAHDREVMAVRPRHVARADWRAERQGYPDISWIVRDGNYRTRPNRVAMIPAFDGRTTELVVFETGKRGKVIERIDLRAPDAQDRLARYTF